MRGSELLAIREDLGLNRDEMAVELGYRGNERNNTDLMRAYEEGRKQIPLTVARLAWVIGENYNARDLPEWPEWEGYDEPLGHPINYEREAK